MKKLLVLPALIFLLVQCIPEAHKDQLKDLQLMVARDNLYHSVSLIEMHKLRNGSYPESLSEIRFIGMMDSSALAAVDYHKLPEGYELNMAVTTVDMSGNTDNSATLVLPADFWNGLGCRKSNLRKD